MYLYTFDEILLVSTVFYGGRFPDFLQNPALEAVLAADPISEFPLLWH